MSNLPPLAVVKDLLARTMSVSTAASLASLDAGLSSLISLTEKAHKGFKYLELAQLEQRFRLAESFINEYRLMRTEVSGSQTAKLLALKRSQCDIVLTEALIILRGMLSQLELANPPVLKPKKSGLKAVVENQPQGINNDQPRGR